MTTVDAPRAGTRQARVLTPEIRARILELRAKGLGSKRISKLVPVSTRTIERVIHPEGVEGQLRSSRDAKRRRKGTCETCGNPTAYAGTHASGVNGTSRLCRACGAVHSAAMGKARRGHGPTQMRVLRFLADDGPRRFMEVSRALGIKKHNLGPTLHRLRKHGLVERPARGLYRLTEEGRRLV